MRFEQLPEWAIAGPVVCKDGEPIFTRHKIHKMMSPKYSDMDDVVIGESIVRKYVEKFQLCGFDACEQMEREITNIRLAKMK